LPYYHIRIIYHDPESIWRDTLYQLDLTDKDVETFVELYQRGQVLFKGKWRNVSSIEELEIRETPDNSGIYKSMSGLGSVEGVIFGSRGVSKDVTTMFIKSKPKFIEKHAKQSISDKNVFIVHGHDIQPVEELKRMLIGFGLNPIVLHEQPSGSRTIVEKLEKYSDVGYTFVILTVDDVFYQKKEVEELVVEKRINRARQNVILEFGYFVGKLGRDKVCCLHKGDAELPSDMQGIVYVRFKESIEECRDMIIKELRKVGYTF